MRSSHTDVVRVRRLGMRKLQKNHAATTSMSAGSPSIAESLNEMSIFISRSSTTKCGRLCLAHRFAPKKFEIAIECFELSRASTGDLPEILLPDEFA